MNISLKEHPDSYLYRSSLCCHWNKICNCINNNNNSLLYFLSTYWTLATSTISAVHVILQDSGTFSSKTLGITLHFLLSVISHSGFYALKDAWAKTQHTSPVFFLCQPAAAACIGTLTHVRRKEWNSAVCGNIGFKHWFHLMQTFWYYRNIHSSLS